MNGVLVFTGLREVVVHLHLQPGFRCAAKRLGKTSVSIPCA